MGELLAIAFIGGFITGVSPCIVPVLPVVVAGGSTGSRRARPFLIIAGLVLSFSLAELLGTTLLSALGLPEDFLFWLGISVLLVLALGLMVPTIGYWTERPFSRLGASRHAGSGGGFVLGLSLGLVFVPCAGPVLAAISVAAANHRVNALVAVRHAVLRGRSSSAPLGVVRGRSTSRERMAKVSQTPAGCPSHRRCRAGAHHGRLSPSACSTRCNEPSLVIPRHWKIEWKAVPRFPPSCRN